MSGDRTIFAIFFGLAMYNGPLIAADDEKPDTEFLEYLGMWEESDEDWLILDKTMTADKDERSDPAPESEESMEKQDER